MKWLLKDKGFYCMHRFYLMSADYIAFCEKQPEALVRSAYNQAIAAATRTGSIQDSALSERASRGYSSTIGCPDDARYNFTAAWRQNLRWGGAKAKASDLKKKHGDKIDFGSSVPKGRISPGGREYWVW
jgi:hypothetical protein